jgi:hypothetical protein
MLDKSRLSNDDLWLKVTVFILLLEDLGVIPSRPTIRKVLLIWIGMVELIEPTSSDQLLLD